MYINKLSLSHFRNYSSLSVDFPRDGAFFEGENGSGKTNILEAIFLLCTGRSQRNAPKSDMVQFDSTLAAVEGEIVSEQGKKIKDSAIVFNKDAIVEMKINDRKISSFAEWFGSPAVVSFSPDDIEIINGNPAQRRRFLDILICLSDKEYLQSLIEYKKNLSLRNVLLKTKMDDILCAIYEEKMAETGATIVRKRTETLENLCRDFLPVYREISAGKDDVFFKYAPSFLSDLSSKKTWKEVFYTQLCDRRKSDQESGFSSRGPHRDDIHFFIDNKPAGKFASQGQSRSIVLSLKISSIASLEKQTGKKPVILFDDAVSELDTDRTQRVYSLIEKQGQIFIASPRKTVSLNESIRRFCVAGGAVVAQ